MPDAGRPTYSKFLMFQAYSDETFQRIRKNILKEHPVKSFKNQPKEWRKAMRELYAKTSTASAKSKSPKVRAGLASAPEKKVASGGCRCVGKYCRCVKPMDLSYLYSLAD